MENNKKERFSIEKKLSDGIMTEDHTEEKEILVQREPGCFFILIDGNESRLEYKLVNNIMDIRDVFVHESQRGRGLAEKLCLAAFAFAKERGWTVHPTCPYVKDKFLKEHLEFSDMIHEGDVFYKAKKK